MIIKHPRGGAEITKWDDWTRPKAPDLHWKPGRSAQALARAWFETGVAAPPPEIIALLATNPRTADVRLDVGVPERVTGLPERGDGRNHDLALWGCTDAGAILICVEAKVDETFGSLIGEYWREAKARETPTRAPERIEKLLRLVFGDAATPDKKPWSGLRYQLLTAVAGTLIEAAGTANLSIPLGVLVIHEFTEGADNDKRRTNDDDYTRFVETLFSVAGVTAGRLQGAKTFPAGDILKHGVDLLVGKAVR